MKRLFFIFFLMLAMTACDTRKAENQIQATTEPVSPLNLNVKSTIALHQPLICNLHELPSDALSVWSLYHERLPTLVLFSDDPFLQPIPPGLSAEIKKLILNGTAEELQRRTAPRSSDPLLMPKMALSAAIDAKLFSRIVWVLPTAPEDEKISVATFQKQMIGYGAVSQAEAQSFVLTPEKSFSGNIRGVPIVAVFPTNLPRLDGPVVVHLDVSFFKPFYKGEIKTPLFPIVYSTLDVLRKASWPLYDVTLSSSNLDGSLPADTRFLGRVVEHLFKSPEMLDKGLPINWSRKKDILYLESLFQPEKILELANMMAEDAHDDPDVEFTLYQAYRDNKDGEKALEHLARAVKLDRFYAMEYLVLAELAQEKKRPDQVLRMLQLAGEALPENPFIASSSVKAYLHLNRSSEALDLVRRLKGLQWSAIYYPTMERDLNEFYEEISKIAQPAVTGHQ